MTTNGNLHKLAEIGGKGESEAMHKILECAMTDEEARFMLELPATNEDLAFRFNMTEKAVE